MRPFFGPGLTDLNADGEKRADVDIARSEMVKSEIDDMIRRRHDRCREAEGHRPSTEMYEESCRRHAEQRREEMRRAWRAFHEGQVARHRAVLEFSSTTTRSRRGGTHRTTRRIHHVRPRKRGSAP